MADLAVWKHRPDPVARIIATRHDEGQETYEWEGEPTWPTLVSWVFEQAAYDDWLERLPWELEKVAMIPRLEVSVYRRISG